MGSIQAILKHKRPQVIFCLLLSLAGFIFNCIAYYPGFMSTDAFDQYEQALTGKYHDWHPTVMAALWHVFLLFSKGQAAMFFFQMLLLWVSFYFLLRFFILYYFRLFPLVILFVFAPFVQNYLGVIYKDVEMALCWLLAIALMLSAFYENRSLKKPELIASLLLITYGCWVRINALPGAIPLLVFLLCTAETRPQNNRLLSVSVKTILVLACIVGTHFALDRFIIKPTRTFPENKLYMQDLTGIYVKTGKNYYPSFINSHNGFDTSYVKENYRYATFDHIWWNRDRKDLFDPAILVFNADSSKVLRSQWLKAISENKEIYLKNRYAGFLNYLQIKRRIDKYYFAFPYVAENNYGIEFKPNAVSDLFIKSIDKQGSFFYMKPWFWALLNIVLFPLVFIKRLKKIKWQVLPLILSGFFYLAPQFFIFQVDTDFRYFYWNCLSLSLALILMLGEFFKPGPVLVNDHFERKPCLHSF